MIKDRKNESFREFILKAGIIDAILNIFLNRDISTISDCYIELIYNITTPSNTIFN
jgi:hypothetical protein